MLVIEKMHHSGRPVPHGDEIRRRSVQAQQTQGSTLLHAVHGIPERQTLLVTREHTRHPHGPNKLSMAPSLTEYGPE